MHCYGEQYVFTSCKTVLKMQCEYVCCSADKLLILKVSVDMAHVF